mgnify:CR=1 FL=1
MEAGTLCHTNSMLIILLSLSYAKTEDPDTRSLSIYLSIYLYLSIYYVAKRNRVQGLTCANRPLE